MTFEIQNLKKIVSAETIGGNTVGGNFSEIYQVKNKRNTCGFFSLLGEKNIFFGFLI